MQHDYEITRADANTGIAFRAAVNAALQAQATNNSGATEPVTPYAFMWWADSANDLLRIRNATNTAWIVVGTLSAAGFGIGAGDVNVASSIHGAPEKTTPVDADTMPLIDSAASNVLKKISWSNVKAVLKAYFDTIYAIAAKGVTNGDSHDHSGGDGAQIDHTTLLNKGTNTHAQIDSHIGSTSNPHSTTADQVLPSQTGNSGKFLTTNGTSSSWGTPSAGSVEGTGVLSTGETGGTKYLREDGDGTCSWQDVPGGGWDGDISDINLDGGTDIGADLSDADLILVDDGAAGTNRKSAISRMWTYVLAKIQAITSLSGHGWFLDEDTMSSNSDTKVPSQQSVKAYADTKSPIASPTFTGTPAAPTASTGTNTTQIATTAFVNAEIANDAAPVAHVGATGSAHGAATTSVAGFMSASDKTKLDGVSGANTGDETASRIATIINGATAKTTPADADVFALLDSAASNALKKMTWANIAAAAGGGGGGGAFAIVNYDQDDSPVSLNSTSCNGYNTFTNTGATGETVFNLSAGAGNYTCTFEVTAAQFLKVVCTGSETAGYGSTVGAAGGYVRSNVIGTRWKMSWNGSRWSISDLIGVLNYDE